MPQPQKQPQKMQQQPSERPLNGVDTPKLMAFMDMVRDNPELARSEFRATNDWIEGAHNRAQVKDFYTAGEENKSRKVAFTFDMDEPPVLLGQNRGTNPVEMVLIGLSGCMMTTMTYYASAMGVTVNKASLELEGDIDLQGLLGLSKIVRPGYQEIRVKFHLDTDGTPEQEDELIEKAKNHSPVYNTINKPVPIHVEKT